jgi:hypothetical protein
MIEMAKFSVARPAIDTIEHADSVSGVQAPSMMRLCCNMIEVLRLREELIQRLHETALLKQLYIR